MCKVIYVLDDGITYLLARNQNRNYEIKINDTFTYKINA